MAEQPVYFKLLVELADQGWWSLDRGSGLAAWPEERP